MGCLWFEHTPLPLVRRELVDLPTEPQEVGLLGRVGLTRRSVSSVDRQLRSPYDSAMGNRGASKVRLRLGGLVAAAVCVSGAAFTGVPSASIAQASDAQESLPADAPSGRAPGLAPDALSAKRAESGQALWSGTLEFEMTNTIQYSLTNQTTWTTTAFLTLQDRIDAAAFPPPGTASAYNASVLGDYQQSDVNATINGICVNTHEANGEAIANAAVNGGGGIYFRSEEPSNPESALSLKVFLPPILGTYDGCDQDPVPISWSPNLSYPPSQATDWLLLNNDVDPRARVLRGEITRQIDRNFGSVGYVEDLTLRYHLVCTPDSRRARDGRDALADQAAGSSSSRHLRATSLSCPSKPNPAKWMVTLGDSYTSGEGTFSYVPSTDRRGVNHCHRSKKAYSELAFQSLAETADRHAKHIMLACSGARTEHLIPAKAGGKDFCGSGCKVRSEDAEPEAPQIDRLANAVERARLANAEISTVVVGIGGNDTGFSAIVSNCVSFPASCVDNFDPDEGGSPPKGAVTVGAAAHRVGQVVDLVHEVAPTAHVIVVGYPVWVAKKPSCRFSHVANLGNDEALWFRSQIKDLNRGIESEVASREYASFLSLGPIYRSGLICQPGPYKPRMMNHLISRGSDLGCISNKSFCNESFHPTKRGHARTAPALAACIADPTRCTPAGRQQE